MARPADRPARPRFLALITLVALLPPPSLGQQGDKAGEEQRDLPADLEVPPAPVLRPEDGLRSLTVQPGFRVELVAAEPLIEDPVAIQFDPDGRLWAIEMVGFMSDVDGSRELAKVGKIVILDDTDGDGVMDRRSVFLDHLILPRALALAFGGALVIEPPDLNFYKDEDGDGRVDLMQHLLDGFAGLDSPEHAGNALTYGIDNWIHMSQHGLRVRFDGVGTQTQPTPGHGQWGLARDDEGRFYYTTNSDPLRTDLVPLHYARRNPALPGLIGVNERILDDFSVWPTRMTTGVNRGYQPATLNDAWRLNQFTAACGPAIYRGARFPQEFHGDAFICEPSGNLVKRCQIEEDPKTGALTARNAYDGAEFLVSTDERFRPVNATTGPDGGLYIVDMYRGILQHKVFMTSFLRKQVIDRGLDKPVGLGRIYRVVPDTDASPQPRPALSSATDDELVATLSHPNGWWRDTAQRLLVERPAIAIQDSLRALANGPDSLGGLHALWTLEGIAALTFEDAADACGHEDPLRRIHGLRLLETLRDQEIFRDLDAALAVVSKLTRDPNERVRVQATLSLGAFDSEAALRERVLIATQSSNHRPTRSALLSGLRGRETWLLEQLFDHPAWVDDRDGRDAVIKGLSDCALRSRDPRAAADLIELAIREDGHAWQRGLLLEAVRASLRLDSKNPRHMQVSRPPRGLAERIAAGPDGDSEALSAIENRLQWPGRELADDDYVWSEEEQALRPLGSQLYASVCANCHQKDGRGLPGIAPSLAESEWVLGSEQRLIRILLHGLSGPLEVDGQHFNADMPKAAAPSDRQIAAILTFVRSSFENNARPIAPDQVRAIRDDTRGRTLPWTAPDLLKIDE